MKEKPKILFLVQLPPPVHGVTLVNKQAVENPYLQNNYSLKILPLDFGQTLYDIGRITPGKLFRMFTFTIRLFFTMVSFRPRIVYFTIMPTGRIFYRDAVLGMLIKLFNRRIIFHLHGKGIKEAAKEGRCKRWVYKKLFKRSSIICLSDRLKEDVAEVHTGHLYILPNGIPEANIGLSKIENHQPVIVFLSNLKKDKGIEVFLNSLLQIQEKKIPFKARIVGDEYDFSFQDAKDFVERNGLEEIVEVMGPRFGNEKLQILKASDIFVLPSMNECFPLAILEAMQEGLPVISTVMGGIPDMLEDGKQGLLVQPGEVDDLAKKLEVLLLEPAVRKSLGQNARKKFESSYTIEKFNLGLAEIFEKVNAQ